MLDWFSPKKYDLRPYQKEAVEAWLSCFKWITWPSILVLPTWSWKSLVIANIVNKLEGRTLIFQPSKEILEQNYEKFITYSDTDDVGIYSASVWEKQKRKIVFAMIGSIINCKEEFQEYKNIIIDECHYVNPQWGMYEKFISFVWTNRILGLTATPYRLASNSLWSCLRFLTRTKPSIFKKVLYHSQIRDLKREWFLADLEYYPVKGFDSSKVRSNSTGADYQDSSLLKYYKEIKFDNSILDVTQRLVNAGRKNILVFTKFTDEARLLVEQLGDIAQIVTAETKKKDRERILSDFKAWKIKVIANVWVLTTWFDFPELETVVLARPTKSLALYYQMVGRGMRPHKDKKSCWIVDMCENTKRFWKVEDLELVNGKDKRGESGQRYIHTNGRKLTNIYF